MKTEVINLKKFYPLKNDVFLRCYVTQIMDCNEQKPALIIVPGGGYQFVSEREADPIAFSFLLKNYNCFILYYSVNPNPINEPLYPQPHLELIATMDYIKKHCKQYQIVENQIFMIGFSAGAHLVGSFSYLYKNKELIESLKIADYSSLRPTAICLSYPVITMGKSTHYGSKQVLTNDDKKLIDLLSIENHITNDYPPTFLWTTQDDAIVPYENTLMMHNALEKANIKNEMYIYPHGPHGLSIATKLVCPEEYKDIEGWVDKCDSFFKKFM